ncbi:1208_t:CDS:2 [Acaulospora colombiana]|uniref:1208_t:CDS:1 n=1 Tax=Acaulospora colombiana TaxID=27376 RepID=A0ACA9N7E6_9GLOM|nr:1208_t:CDS:2 [Acaulospora colombiana]
MSIMPISSNWRITVQKSTIDIFKEHFCYTHESTKRKIELDKSDIEKEISNAKFYQDGAKIVRPIVAENQEIPRIEVVDDDCLSYALDLKKKGMNPVVLNMANPEVPGYLYGAAAQEENLFRRTNLFQYHDTKWYPLPNAGGIYSPNALVIKDNEQKEYELLLNHLSLKTLAALCDPELVRDSEGRETMTPEGKELTRHKIRAILNIGLDNGHDSIVLSAFGCGAFCNPPATMAQLFREIITNEYAGGVNLPKTYRHIGFAIFDDEMSRLLKGDEGNLPPFKKIFDNFIW